MDSISQQDFTLPDRLWQQSDRDRVDKIKQALEIRARTGQAMPGFSLARADLSEIDLVNHSGEYGYQLTHSDLYRADLRNAHLYKLDLSGSSLMKANLTGANLHYANLSGCNLLGTVFKHARLEHVHWGSKIIQEEQASKEKNREQQIDLYQQAEEIFRNLRQTAENQGLFETAGYFFQKEMTMRRRQMPRYSFRRNLSKLVDLFCGYGEQPLRVILFSWALILVFATLYFFAGLSFSGESLAFDPQLGWLDNIKVYFSALYFSVVTFTTLGYGDLAPVGIARALAATEAFIGSFTIALFVVVFVKKMTR